MDHKGRKHTARSETKLPQIPQSFIESYCKNPVDKVLVEYSQPMGENPSIPDFMQVEAILKLTNNEITIKT